MRRLLLLFSALPIFSWAADSEAFTVWNQLKEKREMLSYSFQEFDTTQTYKMASDTQSSTRTTTIEMSNGRWREASDSGSGEFIRIFDGKDLFSMEGESDEYVKVKRNPKAEAPLPAALALDEPDWPKAAVKERHPCGFKESDHECVVLDIPLKLRMKPLPAQRLLRYYDRMVRVSVDTSTGLILSKQTVQMVDNGRMAYQSQTLLLGKRLKWGGQAETDQFQIPAGRKEVKELAHWNAARMKKVLVGKSMPELTASDLGGATVKLSAFRGKTVLLDFWATWCPPCREDAPALAKLYKKYGGKELEIVGISVSEERATVEKFLKGHASGYPIVLTSENDLSRPYEVGVFPTYMVIDKDGNLASVVEGERGFVELRDLLKKAGMDLD